MGTRPETSDGDKTTLGPDDYSGLQIDTRAIAHRSEFAHRVGGGYRFNVQDHGSYATISPISQPNSWLDPRGHTSQPSWSSNSAFVKQAPPQPAPKHHTLRTVILAFVASATIIGAVLGGVLGSRNLLQNAPSPPSNFTTPSSSTSASAATAAPSSINNNLPKSDAIVGSAIVPIAYTANNQDSFSLLYQSAGGNIRFTNKNQLSSSWIPATDILTDALNGTGIAAVTYLNNSTPQSTMYYVGSSSTLREKRYAPDFWHLAPLADLHVPVTGNFSLSSSSDTGGWNGFRLTSIFSSSFSTGPGVRLFCHQSNETSVWLQELVWIQSTDSWSYGARISGISHDAHMCAVLESESQALRVFYSTGANGTDIGEAWTNITTSGPAIYKPGITIENALVHPHASFSAIAVQNETYIYYSALNAGGNVTVNEMQIPATEPTSNSGSGSQVTQNLFHHSQVPQSLVAQPALRVNDSQAGNSSVFVPLGATVSAGGDKIMVFYPEGVVDERSGYGSLKSVWRNVGEGWDLAQNGGKGKNEEGVPMGD